MLVRFVSCKHCPVRLCDLQQSCPPRFSGLQYAWFNFIRSNSSYSKKNFYQVLEVQPSSDPKYIKDNFYKLSKECHPDLNKDDPAALTKFKEIVEAYEVLSNPEEKKKYDEYNGFNSAPKTNFSRGRVIRRFHRGGLNDKGQFVDDMGPPVMREIQYDLSQEKMEKVWERYKERWNQIDEIERVRELKKKKIEFRKKIDERRANMQNMSPEEKEDFLFKLRMLRADAAIKGDGSSFGEEKSDKSQTAPPSGAKTEESKAGDEGGMEAGNGGREWFNREREKVNKNLDWRHQLREDIKKKLEEEGDKVKNVRDHVNKYYRSEYTTTQDEEDEKRHEDDMRQYVKTTFDFGDDDDEKKDKRGMSGFRITDRDDMTGVDMSRAGSFNEWLSRAVDSTKESVEEIKTSRPFSYSQRSVKHGVVSEQEIRISNKVVAVCTLSLIFFCTIEFMAKDDFDNILPKDNK